MEAGRDVWASDGGGAEARGEDKRGHGPRFRVGGCAVREIVWAALLVRRFYAEGDKGGSDELEMRLLYLVYDIFFLA